ncbi:hypothetical protein FHS27_005523 [Rhodopirellula rubra]|uniref:Uncharacterized protein n=1 Tax=Aporhodopirellula rubra TaxID=980271 RepID=A0A7W5E4Y5_9BACT|nr:hypothetical protein [Aporhodopirellula rubra]MBB3209683.1 hypothetical protein [Aporhodopirellula rubra]
MSPSDSLPTSNPQSTASQSTPSRRPRFSGSQIWISLIAAVVLGGLLVVVIRTMGYVQGEEFSPTHFRSRTFSFYEIPLIHWQITPIQRATTTPATALMFAQKKWISPPTGNPKIWHLVSIRRGLDERNDADAALLMSQLRLRADGSAVWRKWSQQHPKLANVLWPAVAKLADRELYILMPRLLEMARRIESVPTLRSTISSYLSEEYTSLIRDMRAAGHDDLADALAAEANEDKNISVPNAGEQT